jgi:serine/threonine-protein kinase
MARETLTWGDRWGTEIDDELDKCECYFLLLSDAAAKSDAVIGELARAHRRRDRESPPSPRIIVLRVRLTIEPAYDIGYRIEPFQQREWNSDADTEKRTSELLTLLAGPETTAQQGPKSLTKSAQLPPPSPAAGLPGGRLPVHSDLYQTRSGLDSDALRYALSPPSILRLRGPRQVGKSSLMARLLEEPKRRDIASHP